MAIETHLGFGPTLDDVSRYGGSGSFEFTGVSAGDAGWVKYGGTGAATLFSSSAREGTAASTFTWMFFYFHTPRSLSASGYKSLFKLTGTEAGFPYAAQRYVSVELYNDGGTYKFRITQDGVQKVLSSTARDLDKTYRICVKLDTSASPQTVTLYVDGTSDISNSSWTDIGANSIGMTGVAQVYTSSEAVDAWWSSFVGRQDTTDTEDETKYPELHQHLPTADGNYAEYTQSGGGAGVWTEWEEAAQDGDTSYNVGANSGTPRQTSQVAGRTYTNTIIGLLWLAYARSDVATKNLPNKAFLRQSATDKELTLPVVSTVTYVVRSAVFDNPPTGSWDLDGTPVLEIGSRRSVDGANLRVTAIMAEGIALGTTNKAPPDPPAAGTLIIPNRPIKHLLRR